MTDEKSYLDNLKREIAGRLRPMCGHFSPEDFEQLLDDVARIHHTYEQRAYDQLGVQWPIQPRASEGSPRR